MLNKPFCVSQEDKMQKVLALVGPTAIGKSKLAVELAGQLNAEIVSGDSMQTYREVSIGTARPTVKEQAGIPHYLVATNSIYDSYSVKEFVDQAQAAISQIAGRGKLPFLVGGTGFYVYSLLNQLQLGEKQNYQLHILPSWQKFLTTHGPKKLWAQLYQRDPAAANKISWQNERRVLRALTVIQRTGQKFSQQQKQIPPRYDYLLLGLNSERSKIYQRINQRVDQMVKEGIIDEARLIYQNRDRVQQLKQAIAYKEFFPYFAGTASLDSCIRELKKNSRHYAKRQLTYFRNKMQVEWFDPLLDPDCMDKMLKVIREWLDE